MPVDELPAPLASVLGYEFYEEVSEGDRFREYLLSPDEKHHWKFYARADDVAQDIAELLADLEGDASPNGTVDGRTVYLAVAASDVAESRDELRRELERRGHRVLPQRTLPLVAEELSAAVNDDLSEADVAVHLLGARYGTRPEGEDRSIPHLQLDLASEIAARRDLIQLIWTAQDLSTVEEAEASLIDRLERTDADTWGEVVRAPLETFKAYLLDRLAPAPPPAASASPQDAKRVYLVYDPEDREQAAALQTQLQDLGHAVLPPLSEGSESEVREVHETSMVLSDAVLIYYGRSTEHWLRMKLLDLLKAPGWGRTEPFQAAAVWVAPPVTTHKKGFRSNEAMVLDATANQGSSVLQPFLARLIASGASP